MKKITFISLFLILVAIFISGCLKQISAEINDRTCSSNNDCVIVPKLDFQDPCCGTWICGDEDVTIINKQAEIKRSKWLLKVCKGIKCPRVIQDCYMEKTPTPKCINNLCEIEWVERNSSGQLIEYE